MYPQPIQNLIDLLVKFPGIGPRQAARLAFFVIKNGDGFAAELAQTITEVKNKTGVCSDCFRTIELEKGRLEHCSICSSPHRNQDLMAVVEKESDLHNLEKSGSFRGIYHLLGGTISPLDAESPKKLHLRELFTKVQKILTDKNQAEIVLATNSTTEGDTTALYIERILAPLKNKYPGLVMSRLARGLSLGSELEYADESTIKNALENRKKLL